MNEEEKDVKEEKTEVKTETETTEDKGDGDVAEEVKLGPIEKAEAVAKRAEAASERLEKANAKSEELKAKEILSGKTEAGEEKEEKEETPAEYKDRIMKGEWPEKPKS